MFAVQCNPRQANQIHQWVQDIKAGKTAPRGIVYQQEIGVSTDTITDEIVQNMGINADPGKGVVTR